MIISAKRCFSGCPCVRRSRWMPSCGRLALAFGLLIGASVWAQRPAIQERAAEQIAFLLEEKKNRTAVQHKISSRLLLRLKQARGDLPRSVLPRFRTGLEPLNEAAVLVDIEAEDVAAVAGRIEALGGRVLSAHPRFHALRASLALDRIEELASLPELRLIRPADRMITRGITRTEGDVAHGTDTARTQFGVDGSGVQVGAMSDSVDALDDLLGTDLPAEVTVLEGQSGNPGTSEGTALLEIIHDMAPGADLFFATGAGGQAQMAQNILDLAAAGCDVIVDDVGYFAEPVFQDGVIAQAVDSVFLQGVVYFSAAGNAGNLNDGESGVWEGDYVGITLPTPLNGAGVSAHDFGGGTNFNTVRMDSPFFYTLQWADPQGQSGNDYDLFLLDAAMENVLAGSTSTQNGTQNPFELIDTTQTDDTDAHLVVVQVSGESRFLHLNTHRGRLTTGTDGQIFGHPAAVGALAVAAVQVQTAGGGQFTGGAANPVEPFSSDGPRRIFFNPDGSPVGDPARGDLGGIVRQKPDVAAADGVMTSTPGFNPFFGTSASAPHGAGIAALFVDLFPSIPVGEKLDIFRSSALDIEDFGFDRDSGAGIIMGEQSLGTPIFVDGFESGNTSAWTK